MSDTYTPPEGWILHQETVCRHVRVGVTPVLTVTVEYPVLTAPSEGEIATARFNETYRRAAEAYLAWATDAPAREAEEAFLQAGTGATYAFPRREALCKMTAVWTGEEDEAGETHTDDGESDRCGVNGLCVNLCATFGIRRFSHEKSVFSRTDRWAFPSLIRLPDEGRRTHNVRLRRRKKRIKAKPLARP